MRLVIPEVMLEITFAENNVYELIIENPNLLADIIDNIYLQVKTTGVEKKIILSEDDKELSFSKCCELIFNPFEIDFNNRKIVNALYQEVCDIAQTQLVERTAYINGQIVEYLDEILQSVPYAMDYSYEIDVLGLAKAFKMGIKDDSVSLVEKLVNYIKIQKNVLNVDIIILVNIKQFLAKEDYQELVKSALYEKVTLLNISSNESYCLSVENRYIIDNGLCLIDMN